MYNLTWTILDLEKVGNSPGWGRICLGGEEGGKCLRGLGSCPLNVVRRKLSLTMVVLQFSVWCMLKLFRPKVNTVLYVSVMCCSHSCAPYMHHSCDSNVSLMASYSHMEFDNVSPLHCISHDV